MGALAIVRGTDSGPGTMRYWAPREKYRTRFFHVHDSASTYLTNCRSCSRVVFPIEKNPCVYKWTHTVQTHAVQGSTVFLPGCPPWIPRSSRATIWPQAIARAPHNGSPTFMQSSFHKTETEVFKNRKAEAFRPQLRMNSHLPWPFTKPFVTWPSLATHLFQPPLLSASNPCYAFSPSSLTSKPWSWWLSLPAVPPPDLHAIRLVIQVPVRVTCQGELPEPPGEIHTLPHISLSPFLHQTFHSLELAFHVHNSFAPVCLFACLSPTRMEDPPGQGLAIDAVVPGM